MEAVKRGSAERIEELIRDDDIEREYRFDYKNSIEIIEKHIREQANITVIGDYDADGVCASAILFLVLKCLGAKPAVRLPLRFAEGYGMKTSMIDEIDSGLVITVDNGITAFEPAKAAREKGLALLITDHHLPVTENGDIVLPEADCLIDPHIEEINAAEDGYDYHGYCGAGIALKIAEKLLENAGIKDAELEGRIYSFAAVATIADVMEITGDNKKIVRNGITAMTEGRITSGLGCLMREAGIRPEEYPRNIRPWMFIKGSDISHNIGPCINAPSRMVEEAGEDGYTFVKAGGDGAKISLNCLVADRNAERATVLAAGLKEYNRKRKAVSEKALECIEGVLEKEYMTNDSPIMLAIDGLKQGICGNVAGRLEEIYRAPVVLLCSGEGGLYHGSCRSPEGLNIREKLDTVAELLESYGGHAGAAGVTVKKENIAECRMRLIEECNGFHAEKKQDNGYDLELDIDDIPHVLDIMAEKMAPFGEGNEEPRFLVKDFLMERKSILNGKHVKFSGNGIEAIGFNLTENGEMPEEIEGSRASFIARLEYNCFRGTARPQLMIEKLL